MVIRLAHVCIESTDLAVSDKELGVDHTWMVTCHNPDGVFIELHQYTEQNLQKNRWDVSH